MMLSYGTVFPTNQMQQKMRELIKIKVKWPCLFSPHSDWKKHGDRSSSRKEKHWNKSRKMKIKQCHYLGSSTYLRSKIDTSVSWMNITGRFIQQVMSFFILDIALRVFICIFQKNT